MPLTMHGHTDAGLSIMWSDDGPSLESRTQAWSVIQLDIIPAICGLLIRSFYIVLPTV